MLYLFEQRGERGFQLAQVWRQPRNKGIGKDFAVFGEQPHIQDASNLVHEALKDIVLRHGP